jgi:hypothetical protein
MRTFRHYRSVLREIGRDLLSFGSTKELVTTMRDAVVGTPNGLVLYNGPNFTLAAHRHAYYNAKTLQRDISAGNILITSSGRGLLIDWDPSKSTNVESSVSAQTERTVSLFYGSRYQSKKF